MSVGVAAVWATEMKAVAGTGQELEATVQVARSCRTQNNMSGTKRFDLLRSRRSIESLRAPNRQS